MKRCSQCKENLRFEKFDIRGSQRDGRQMRPECRACRVKLNRAYWDARVLKRDTELEAYRDQIARGYTLKEVKECNTEDANEQR